jgi:hypothetical protein
MCIIGFVGKGMVEVNSQETYEVSLSLHPQRQKAIVAVQSVRECKTHTSTCEARKTKNKKSVQIL